MRVVAFGGRWYGEPSDQNPNWRQERNVVHETLEAFHVHHPITVLIEGEASGADRAAKAWAYTKGIRVEPYKADWTLYGDAAGPIRNKKMLVLGKPDWGIAFPGNKGTRHMTKLLRDAHIPVLVVPR